MSYSLLAHLYPRIKGSQEDVATYSLSYILEQSPILNESFTKLIREKMELDHDGVIQYKCQDSDPELGRPDIAGYKDGQLRVLCEAKFYAGLTENQPVSYIKRLQTENTLDNGLIFICPKSRMTSLWNKLSDLCIKAGTEGNQISEQCVRYSNVNMSIISWNEIIADLLIVATERDPERLGDVRQLQGFCDRIESEAFIPFSPQELGPQTARDMDRYYDVVDEVRRSLHSNPSFDSSLKGLRMTARREGYSQGIYMDGIFASIDFLRNAWKSPTTVDTPFWTHIVDVTDGKWITTDRYKRFISTIDSRRIYEFYGDKYIALKAKPYATIDELADDLASQIIELVNELKHIS